MSIYNEDELVAPDWINQEFFEIVLRKYENNDKITINSLDISPACMKGEHYASIMFRCKIVYSTPSSLELKHKSVILKTLPVEGNKAEMLKDTQVFETEISMYSETLPKIEEKLKEIGEDIKMGAKLIYHSLKPHKCIIMEDLCEIGYKTISGRYLTEDEMKVVYAKIAKFHAVAHMLGQSEEREIVTKYKDGLFSTSPIMSMDFIRNGILYFMQMLEEYTEFSIYLEKVKKMQPLLQKGTIDLYNAYRTNKSQGDIFVLNHGDFHMKNLMFKTNENGKVIDVIFVDYQICCYAPSAIDAIYSQYTILSPELRLRSNEFMQYYFMEFLSLLKNFNYLGALPSYADFQIARYRYRHFALFALSTFSATFGGIITSNAEDLKDINGSTMLVNSDLMLLAYKNPRFIDDMRNYLPQMLRDGYLD